MSLTLFSKERGRALRRRTEAGARAHPVRACWWLIGLLAAVSLGAAPCRASVRYSPGPSGVMLHWPGHSNVTWHLCDASGERIIGTSFVLQPLRAGVMLVPPGSYVVRIDGVAGCAPIPVKVAARRVAHVTPAVGDILLKWRGIAPTSAILLDATGEREIQRVYVQANSNSYIDVGPGRYTVGAAVPGLKPAPVTVHSGGVSPVAPVVGTIALHWRGLGGVIWTVMNEHAQRDVAGPAFVQPSSTQYMDVGAGHYAVRANTVGLPPTPVTVQAFRVAAVRPPVGTIVFYWNGASGVIWRLWDPDDQSALSAPSFSMSNSRNAVDVGPGAYRLKLDGTCFPPMDVKVTPGQILRVKPAVGTLRLSFSTGAYLHWSLYTEHAASQIGGPFLLLKGPPTSVDLPPGRYAVVLPDPDFTIHNVVVGEGKVSHLAL